MGFFGAMGRMIAGKPVFEDPEAQTGQAATQAQQSAPLSPEQTHRTPLDAQGYKIIPKIAFEHVHTHRDGEHMLVSSWVKNESEHRVRIDSVRILGQKNVLNRELAPGEAHELIVYKGQTPHDDHDRRGEVIYRLMASDDLFENFLYIGYERESDGGYLVDELRHDGPTKDI